MNIFRSNFQIGVALLAVLFTAGGARGQAQPAQGFPVSGTVTAALDNSPRSGVSVQLKGTNTGVFTNSSGGYQLTARSAQDTLVFSFLGFETQEVPVGGRSTINVALEQQVLQLQEIVIQGYGSQARELVSGAVSQVTSEQLEGAAFTTVSESLMGMVQGLNIRLMGGAGTNESGEFQGGDFQGQSATAGTGDRIAGSPNDGRPGAPAALQIRNQGTPLYLIDNVPATPEEFNNLNPADIATVSVLKDAAAAVYGFRASNGVVLVTTKRGGRDSAPRVSISGYYGAQNPTRYHFEYLVNAYEYQHSVVDNFANVQAVNGNYGIPTAISPEELEKWRIGAPGYESYDYYDIIMNNPNAPAWGADVSVSGGTANAQYRLSLGHQQTDYIIKDPTYGRTSLSANLQASLTERFSIGAELRATNAVREDIAIQGFQDPIRIALLSINTNLAIHRPYIGPNNDLINFDIRTAALSRTAGQINMDVSGKSENVERSFSGNFWAEYTFVFGTTLRATVNASNSTRDYDLRRKLFPMYSTDPVTGEPYFRQFSGNRDRQHLERNADRTFMSLQASHSLQLGGHSISAVAFWEREGDQSVQTFTISNSPTDYSDLINYADLTDYGYDWGISRRASVGGRIDYDYNQKYLATLLGRYDGTHLYAPGRRWGFFPGISIGWRITEEAFMQDRFGFLNELKLRASWGETGSEQATAWAYLEGATYGVGAGSVLDGQFIPGVRPRGLPESEPTWVTNTTKNLGADVVFMQGKLSAEIDYFERLREGILGVRAEVSLPSELGYGLPRENLNADITKGLEAIVTWADRIGSVNYSISPNLTIARSAPHFRYGQEFGNAMQEYFNGQLVGRWSGTSFMQKVEGQFQTFEEIANHPVNHGAGNRQLLPGDLYYRDTNGDGIINNDDQRPLGYSTSGTPLLSFGAATRVQYGNLSFTMNLAGATMFSHLREFETRVLSQGDHMMAKYAMDRWMREDPYNPHSQWIPGRYPPLRRSGPSSTYGVVSDFWRTNVRFLRIRRMELSYNVPNSLADNVGLSGLRIYTNLQNPITFDNQSHINMDPEVTQGNGMVYPTTRLVNVGFSATVGGQPGGPQ